MRSQGDFRPEIQGLRAIAVTMVLVYHVWPKILPGGYAGVDVFFVISGYLITSLLLRELAGRGRIDLAQFYVRRARRLLPAALATLAAIMLGALLLMPVTQRVDVAREVAAAALYVENWWLAAQAVDYLAMGEAPSPVQHFWSLSVEEQFYFIWPVALVSLYAVTRRAARTMHFDRAFAAFAAAVIIVSLAWSVYSGLAGSGASYFSSFTRIWQLAAGGMLAVLPRWQSIPMQRGFLVAGLAGILSAGLLLSSEVAYPGYAALLPTLATFVAILAGPAYASSALTRWLGSRPTQYLGDISYSLYLWHWPVIIFTGYAVGSETSGLLYGAGALVVSVALGALSKRYIEDAFRSGHGRPITPAWKVLSVAALASLSCVAFAWTLARASGADEAQAPLVAGDAAYPGAAVMLPGAKPAPQRPFVPALVNVNGDVATAYAERCIPNISGTEVQTCEYGNPSAKVRIAVVGDSHAVHWFPAFQELARHWDIHVVGIAKNACITSAGLPVYNGALNRPYTECNTWAANVIEYLKSRKFDYIVISQSPGHYVDGRKGEGKASNARLLAAGMRELWSRLDGDKAKILVFRSTPWQPTQVRDCVADKLPPYAGCTAAPAKALFDDAISRFTRLQGYPLIDFTDLFCTASDCPAVIGNVFVYRDSHHVTATYMRTLAPMVASRIGLVAERLHPAATSRGSDRRSLESIRPALADAAGDRGEVFRRGCVRSNKQTDSTPCVYGDDSSVTRVAIVGDATGANLMPGLDLAGARHGWKIEAYFKDSCLFSRTPVIHRRTKKKFTECSRWVEGVLKELERKPPALVVLAQSPQYTDSRARSAEEAAPSLAAGITPLVARLTQSGSTVAVLRYTPWLPFNAPECLRTSASVERCVAERQTSLRSGALLELDRGTSKVRMIDLTDSFCSKDTCASVAGDVLVYRDAFQPTETYARTLEPTLSKEISLLLGH